MRQVIAAMMLWLPLLCVGGGEAPQLLTEGDFLVELPIVLAGSRLAQPLREAPAAVTVIDREMIEVSGARHIPDLLRLVPGFQAGSYSGHAHTAAYHGLSDRYARRMQVLVDGRSIYSPAIGGVEWTEVPLHIDDIERIEVIRGPNAATHGANAFQGVISISTRQPFDYDPAALRVDRGQDDIRDLLLQHGSAYGDLEYRVSLAYRQDDGFEGRHDSKHLRHGSMRAVLQATGRDTLEAQIGYSGGDREEGFENDPLVGNNTVDRLGVFHYLRWRHVEGADEELSVQLYHNRETRDESRSGLLYLPVDASGGYDRYEIEAYGTGRAADDIRMVLGAGFRRDELTGPLFLDTADRVENHVRRVFGNLEWRLGADTVLHAGAMWEDSDLGGTDLSPRIAVNHSLAPGHSVRLGFSKAHRNPLFFEERADVTVDLAPPAPPGTRLQALVGGGDLQPETIFSREIGYVAELPSTDATLDIRAYSDSISDLIRQSFVTPNPNPPGLPPPNGWSNLARVDVYGIEGHFQWRPTHGTRLIASYAYADADSDCRDLKESVPRHTWSLMGIVRASNAVTLSATLSGLDDHRWLDDGSRIPGYERLDLRVAKVFRLDGATTEIALTGQSLLGGYKDFLFEEDSATKQNEFDTRVYLTLKLGL